MNENHPPRLRPPLKKPDTALRAAHLVGRPPLIRNVQPIAKPVSPEQAKPTAALATTPSADLKKEIFCRVCDKRVIGSIPPGWYRLVRRIVPGSLGPHLPANRQRQTEMPMGLYCSIHCLISATKRLSELDESFRKQGIGLKPLAPAEQPPLLPPPATKGGIEMPFDMPFPEGNPEMKDQQQMKTFDAKGEETNHD
jgi:hypothetical protein